MSNKSGNYRNRNEELSDLIYLNNELSSELFPPNGLNEEINNVKDFLKQEIMSFSTDIINSMVDSNLVDVEFCYKVFKFDQQFYEQIMQAATQKFYEKFRFNDTLNFVPRCSKTFLQAIMIYEQILLEIKDDINHRKDLSEKLMEMSSKPLYDNLPSDQKKRVSNMLTSLLLPTN